MKTKKRNIKNAYIVQKVADTLGVSTSLVHKVLNETRKNERILSGCIVLHEELDSVVDTLLLKAVKELVPL